MFPLCQRSWAPSSDRSSRGDRSLATAVRGLDIDLAEFGFVEDAVSDALTVADQTTALMHR